MSDPLKVVYSYPKYLFANGHQLKPKPLFTKGAESAYLTPFLLIQNKKSKPEEWVALDDAMREQFGDLDKDETFGVYTTVGYPEPKRGSTEGSVGTVSDIVIHPRKGELNFTGLYRGPVLNGEYLIPIFFVKRNRIVELMYFLLCHSPHVKKQG